MQNFVFGGQCHVLDLRRYVPALKRLEQGSETYGSRVRCDFFDDCMWLSG